MDTRPHTPQEIRRWAWHRLPDEREAVPEPGERLLFRETDFGGTVPAVVTAVQDLSSPHDHWTRNGGLEAQRGPGTPDVHVWRYDETRGQHVMLDDPWPWVHLQVITGHDGDGAEILAAPRWCREARVRGSAGWLREGSRAHAGNFTESGD